MSQPLDSRAVLARALAEIDRLRARVQAQQRERDVAIIGIGCRFPGGSDSPAAFWELLDSGRDAITEVPAERWDADALYDEAPGTPGRSCSRWGGFVDGVLAFDAAHFGLSPREVASMDPQHRLLLEVAWEALEHAGLDPRALAGSRTGVYVGIGMSDFGTALHDAGVTDTYTGTGTGFCFASGRLAYLLGVHGPALSVDTACSSSLVTVHLGCEALRTGEADLVLSGGVNLMLTPDLTVYLSGIRALSPTGRCRTFDRSADGYVRGEGCGLVVLKRLADAERDGDRIYAVIRGSSVNHDGPSSSLTTPNGRAQRDVLRRALLASGVAPGTITYAEAHGTGTPLGDPIELVALGEALSEDRTQPLCVGSVKTNIGHLETAAGIAGLIKTALALHHRRIPAHLHLASLNPAIRLDAIPARVPTRTEDWEPAARAGRAAGPRRATVSAFGLSGTNAVIVLEEAPVLARALDDAPGRAGVLCVSAGSPEALAAQEQRLRVRLGEAPIPPEDLCQSLATGRASLGHRAARVIASDATSDAVARALEPGGAGWLRGSPVPGARARVAFVFTGQGSQYARMGVELHRASPVFRAALDRIDATLAPALGMPLLDLLSAEDDRLQRTALAQPALVALELALVEFWASCGITPSVVLGHSVGEIAAARVAGVLGEPEALRLAMARGRLLEEAAAGGAMATVQGPEAALARGLAALPEDVEIASFNSRSSAVITGPADAVARAGDALRAAGLDVRPLKVSHGFHSRLVDAALPAFSAYLADLDPRPAALAMASTLHGRLLAPAERLDAAYWTRQVREPVRFREAIEAVAGDVDVMIEIGPHPTLLAAIDGIVPEGAALLLPSLRRGVPDDEEIASSVARAWVRGLPVDWAGFYVGRPRRPTSLPTTPFNRGPAPMPAARGLVDRRPPTLLGRRYASPLAEVQFDALYALDRLPILDDHRVYGRAVVSGPTWIAVVIEAAAELLGPPPYSLTEVAFLEALVLPADARRDVRLVISPDLTFRIHSRDEGSLGGWTLHVTGQLGRPSPPAPGAARDGLDAFTPGGIPMLGEELYRQVQTAVGFEFGDSFLRIDTLWRSHGAAVGRMKPSGSGRSDYARHALHPGLHDSCFQVFGACSETVMAMRDVDAVIPVGVDRIDFYGMPAGPLWCEARLWPGEAEKPGMFAGDYRLGSASGPALVATGLRLRRARREVMMRSLATEGAQVSGHTLRWSPLRPTAPVRAGRWLIVGNPADAQAVADPLARAGAEARCAEDLVPGAWDGVVLLPIAAPDAVRRMARATRVVQDLLRLDDPPRLWLVSRGAWSTAGEAADPDQAVIWGLGRVLAVEYPAAFGGLVDLPLEGEAAADLMAAMASGDDGVAIRGGALFGARLSPIGPALPEPGPRFDGGTVVITGGTGALGRHATAWAIAAGAARVVVVSRARAEGLDTPGVIVHRADCADEAAMIELFLHIDETLPPLAGVLHAAGVLLDASLPNLRPDAIAEVFAPKVGGAAVLARLLAGRPDVPLVLYSSASAVLGSPGQGAYAAANAYLDGLAGQLRAEGRRVVSIGWGPWSGGGMAARLDQRPARDGLARITPADGAHWLGRLLDGGEPWGAVLPVDWARFLPGTRPSTLLADVPGAEASATPAAEGTLRALVEAAAPGRRAAVLLGELRVAVNRVLMRPPDAPIGERERFFQLGMDSLMAIELRSDLRRRLGRALPATTVLDRPTLADLAEYLLAEVLVLETGAAADTVVEPAPLSDDEARRQLLLELEDFEQ